MRKLKTQFLLGIEKLEPRLSLDASASFADPLVVASAAKLANNVSVGRFDNDSHVDLIINNTSGTFGERSLEVFKGNGNGQFSRVERFTTLDNVFATRIVDIDKDGDQDLFGLSLGPLTEDKLMIFEGDGTGNLTERAAIPNNILTWDGLRAFEVADLNFDGNLDVIMVGVDGIQLRYGTGRTREFQPGPVLTGSPNARSVRLGDLNDDGRTDIIVGAERNGTASVEVYLNRANGTFSGFRMEEPPGSRVVDIQVADFNNDGVEQFALLIEDDVALRSKIEIWGFDDTIQTFAKFGSIALPFDTGDTTSAMTVADFELDFDIDIGVTRRGVGAAASRGSFVILPQDADGKFGEIKPVNFDDSPGRKIVTGDFNGDLKPDVAVVRQNSADVGVYLNRAVPQNIVQGTVWNDISRDGRFDKALELGIQGRRVFADANNDGLFDFGESSAITREDGTFSLAAPDGDYTLRLEPKLMWVQSLPFHPASQLYPGYFITLRNREVSSGALFGSYLLGNVQGVAFRDLNNNGKFDVVESGLTEARVYVDLNGNLDLDAGEPSVVPRQNGEWGLELAPGRYTLLVKSTGLFSTTRSSIDVNIEDDKDVVTGLAFGQTPPAIIQGRVFYDLSVDGIFNEREESTLGGFQVFIDFNNNSARDANEPTVTTSNSNDPSLKGTFKFDFSFPPGETVVRLIKPNGYEQTAPNRAGSGTEGSVKAFFRGGVNDITFGVYRPIFVSGAVFRDSNGNGIQNANEQPLTGIPVFIDYNNNGLVDSNEPVTVTAVDGTYRVASSREGIFRVRAAGRSGQIPTVPSSGDRRVAFTFGNPITNSNFGFAEGAFSTAPYANPVDIPVDRNPAALVSGDFNRDGNADFIVTTNSSTSQVFLGQGNGSFNVGQTFDSGTFTRFMLARDLTGDGVLDLITANDDEAANAVAVMVGNANGTFKAKQTLSGIDNTYGIAIGNFDGIGPPDIALVGASEPRVGVILNLTNGAMKSTNNPAGGGRSLATADLNGDGKDDLVVANHTNNSVSVLLGKGDGTFIIGTLVTEGVVFPNFVALRDFNLDGKFDLVVSNEFSDEVRVFLGIGNGRFRAGTSYAVGPTPQQIEILDIDQDRNLDLIVSFRSDGTTNISGGVSILRGRGDGTFVEQQVRTAHTSPTAVAIADYNKDGRLDIIAANFFSDDVSYLRNTTPLAVGAVRGFAFNDSNQNNNARAIQDVFSGLRVFADLNRNGLFEASEPWTRTSGNGEYVLANLRPGSYDIRVESDELRVQTLPVGRAANRVVVEPGRIQSSKNFSLAAVQTPNGFVMDDRSATYRGTWTRVASPDAIGQSYIHDGNGSKGSKSIKFDIRVPVAGYYAVAMQWSAGSNRASNVPIEIESGTNTRNFTLNQRTRGDRFNDVGIYYFGTTGGAITIKTHGTNGFVSADAIRLIAVADPQSRTLDNTSSGVSIRGTWTLSTGGSGYIGANYLNDGNPAAKGLHSVSYTPTLASNGVVEIFARWVGGSSRSTRAIYDVTTSSGNVRVVVNQRLNGGKWVSLGFFSLNTANAKVTVRNNGSDGSVIADGIRFVKVQ